MAFAAHEAARVGNCLHAANLFSHAARLESEALRELSPDKHRTYGIIAVSAVYLWYKAGDLKEAERLASEAVATQSLPAFAADELSDLLRTILGSH